MSEREHDTFANSVKPLNSTGRFNERNQLKYGCLVTQMAKCPRRAPASGAPPPLPHLGCCYFLGLLDDYC